MSEHDPVREALTRLSGKGEEPGLSFDRLVVGRRRRRRRRAVTLAAPLLVVGLIATLVVVPDAGEEPGLVAVGELRSQLARSTAPAPEDDVAAVVAADTDLALGLYERFATGNDQNLVFSPYSIALALAMLEPGSAGASRQELHDVLGIDIDDASYHAARNALARQLAAAAEGRDVDGDGEPDEDGAIRLDIANGAFTQAGLPVEPAYLDRLATDYDAGLQTLDFFRAPEPSRVTINDWVAERTDQRILDLLAEGTITPDTRVVLANAVFMEAAWVKPFDATLTRIRPFTRLEGSAVDVDMMHAEVRTAYAEGDGWQAVRLPYQGGASMTVIVPEAGRMAQVESRLTGGLLDQLPAGPTVGGSSAWSDRLVDLALPTFSFGARPALTPALRSLGLDSVLDPRRADLSGITTADQLFLAEAVHQANVEVDEEGTTASAATALLVEVVSAPQLASLTVDRPFIVVIRHDATGAVLFLGRVTDPTKA